MVGNPASRHELVRAATTAASTVRSPIGTGGLGRMTDVLTSWTTSHNASQGRRQTLLVDVDYDRKATSHKRLKRPRRGRGCFRGTSAVQPPAVRDRWKRAKPRARDCCFRAAPRRSAGCSRHHRAHLSKQIASPGRAAAAPAEAVAPTTRRPRRVTSTRGPPGRCSSWVALGTSAGCRPNERRFSARATLLHSLRMRQSPYRTSSLATASELGRRVSTGVTRRPAARRTSRSATASGDSDSLARELRV
jgi:hypothetical protein